MLDKTISFEEFYQRFRDCPPSFTGVPFSVVVPLAYLRQLADVHSRLERIEGLLQEMRPGLAAFERLNPGLAKNE